MKKFRIFLVSLLFLLSGCGESRLVPYEAGGQVKNDLVQDGLMGYKDEHGKIVIKAQYLFAENFNQYGIAAVGDLKQGWIYINKKGNFVIKPYEIDNGYDPFQQGLARFEVKKKIGYFDQRGHIAIPAKFEFAFPFRNGYAAVVKDVKFLNDGEYTDVSGKWGFINMQGNLIIPYKFENVTSYFNKQGIAEVIDKGRKVQINTKGEVVKVVR